ncbi:GAF and ANTAR domain-containing protein [Streptomyces montanisoli]|uniref:GAF and ANTAR domain-containing protein n=1 Tax=Streptomyces montanisoli TaxID=2798581 RepID=A0A940M909_9ACTN|nr:GAF and ANTAR domain-containing protein [Streptomyces montanisoli]MBP0456994.1 GAF and ANTAR domain-containing protein [Streptomyces montanisoli]
MDWQDYVTRLASMARDLLAQTSVDATLEHITTAATDLVEGCDAAGILVVRGKHVESLAPTEAMVVQSDRLQEANGEGPCFDAGRHIGSERVFRISDLNDNQPRWPRYAPDARELGIGSMMGFLLYTEERAFGALNMYSRKPAAFTAESETAGWALASHAAVAFSSARTADQFREALASRHTIGAAMGIIMERYHLPETEAFNVMRRLSQERNVKMRDLARRVCETGTLDH